MDILSKIQRKLHRTFCNHDWTFERVESTRQYWPRNAAFVYVCEKCGSHKAINCADIEALIRKFGEKDNYDYVEETVLLPNGYGLHNVQYAGRDVGRAVKWYYDHEGVLISAYANKQDMKHYGVHRYGVYGRNEEELNQMDEVTFNFQVKMDKENAKYFKDGEHSVSIYFNGPGKIAYCFREIKQSDEVDRDVCEWMSKKNC